MNSHVLETEATFQNFDEAAYLLANPDVADAVRTGVQQSGLSHFEIFGKSEKRRLRFPRSAIADAKRRKLEKIKPVLRTDMPCVSNAFSYDYLSAELREQFNIVETEAVASNDYDRYALQIISTHQNGLVLDCGAGKRKVYYENVVNFEIADYDSTDVRGVGEVLPFTDNCFDAVLSLAVLEHVKDPFLCAREIARVLKPGGVLMCCVPLLQPVHGYPHHYYNMTSQGLANLFSAHLVIDKSTIYESILPIWSLTWVLQSWAAGLEGKTKDDFLQMTVGDFMSETSTYLNMPFVQELSFEKNMELASATVLFAHKS